MTATDTQRQTHPVRTYWTPDLDNTPHMLTTEVDSPFRGVRVEVERFADTDAVLHVLDVIRETIVRERR